MESRINTDPELIDEYIDLLESKSGKIHRYQYSILLIAVFTFTNIFMVMGVSPLFEDKPRANLLNTTSEEILNDIQYTKELCNDPRIIQINITESKGYSIAEEFGFYCDEVLNGLMNASLFAGVVLAMLLLSVCNELFGRKKSIIYNLILHIIVNILMTFSRNAMEAFFGIFFYNVTGMIVAQTLLLLVQESVLNAKRGVFSTIVTLGYTPCMVIFDLLVFEFNSWRLAFIVSAAMSLITLVLTLLVVFESSKTFLKRKDYDMYLITLLRIAKQNRKKERFLKFLVENRETYFIDVFENEEDPYCSKVRSILSFEDIEFMNEVKSGKLRDDNAAKPKRSFSVDYLSDKETMTSIDRFRMELIGKFCKEDDIEENKEDYLRRESIYSKRRPESVREMIQNMEEEKRQKLISNIIQQIEQPTFLIDFIALRRFFRYSGTPILPEIINQVSQDELNGAGNAEDINLYLVEQNSYNNNNTNNNNNNYINYRGNIEEGNLNIDLTKSQGWRRSSGEDRHLPEGDQECSVRNQSMITKKTLHENLNPANPCDLLKYPSQRGKFLCLGLIWILCCGMFFGNTINLKNLKGSILVIGLANSGVEFIGYICSGIFLNNVFFGRTKSNIMYFAIATVGYFCLAFLISSRITVIVLSFIVKLVLAASLNSLFVISGESYPNSVKNYGYAFNTALGKAGALIFTFIIELISDFQMNLMFGVMGGINFIAFFFIKETRGLPLEAEIPEKVIEDK